MTKPSPSVTMPPQTVRSYDWGTYKSCTVYSRSNMNTYDSNINVLGYASEIRCLIDGTEKTVVSVTDKKGFPDAANSIYRFWQDSDGYNVLLVDQNGGGSGEGNGKIVQLFNDYGVTRSCFYFVSHNFVRENVPIEWGTPLSAKEQGAVKKISLTKIAPTATTLPSLPPSGKRQTYPVFATLDTWQDMCLFIFFRLQASGSVPV